MEMTLSMQHYGRGVGKIPMPRALARSPRKEWPVSPSLIIFILAILLILSLKLTMSNKKLLQQTKTIIIIPQTQPAPEPTVPKSIPLMKVLKDAVKKTVEPKKKELKKIAPKKVEPKKPLPKKIEPKKIKPLEKLDKKIEPKKINRNELKPKKLEQKKIETNKITEKKIDVSKPIEKPIVQNKLEQKKIDANPLERKELVKNNLPDKPVERPDFKAKTPDINPEPLTRTAPKVAAPEPTHRFTAMNDLNRKPDVTVPTSAAAPPRTNIATPNQDAIPELTQLESYRPSVESGSTATSSGRIERKVESPDIPAPVHHVETSARGPAIEDLVIINSSAIGNSDRVKNLKRAIMKKAQNLDPARSPYKYVIHNYTCTLTIEGGAQGRIIIDFSPSNAPFDVVSALERKISR